MTDKMIPVPNVDRLSNIIREVDGRNDLGAGALAEKIVEALLREASQPCGCRIGTCESNADRRCRMADEIAAELEFAKQEIANLHDDIGEWMDKCDALRTESAETEKQELRRERERLYWMLRKITDAELRRDAERVKELERFIDAAFEAHPNLDLDVAAIAAERRTPMTDKMIPVPRELLEELRDCAELCADDVRAHDLGEDSAEAHFRQVFRACDALLREAERPECRYCGGLGEMTGEYPGVACPACAGTGKESRPADEELRKDAERYRWLRRKFGIISGKLGAEFFAINLPAPTYVAPDASVELDSAIDSAIAAGREGS